MDEILNNLEPTFANASKLVKKFNKNGYKSMYDSFLQTNELYFAQIKMNLAAVDVTTFVTEYSKIITRYAHDLLYLDTAKIARVNKQLDLNMFMAVYFLPAILENKDMNAQVLAQSICEEWNTVLKSPIAAATHQVIMDGFKKKLCYITTAVCRSMDKPEDCYEVNLLKEYRDKFLLKTTYGEDLVRRYYDIAPTIVKRINKLQNANEKYAAIWSAYLKPCIALIENGKCEECSEIYIDMVEQLQEEYVHTESKRQRG